MMDQKGELNFWNKSRILVKGCSWYCSFYKMHIVFGNVRIGIFVQKQLCGNWCNEGYYSLNVI
jgi:hypothetical protein